MRRLAMRRLWQIRTDLCRKQTGRSPLRFPWNAMGGSRVHKLCAMITGVAILAGTVSAADTQGSSYARIAVLRPHDGDTVDFEAGYIRHLDWHRQAGDKW